MKTFVSPRDTSFLKLSISEARAIADLCMRIIHAIHDDPNPNPKDQKQIESVIDGFCGPHDLTSDLFRIMLELADKHAVLIPERLTKPSQKYERYPGINPREVDLVRRHRYVTFLLDAADLYGLVWHELNCRNVFDSVQLLHDAGAERLIEQVRKHKTHARAEERARKRQRADEALAEAKAEAGIDPTADIPLPPSILERAGARYQIKIERANAARAIKAQHDEREQRLALQRNAEQYVDIMDKQVAALKQQHAVEIASRDKIIATLVEDKRELEAELDRFRKAYKIQISNVGLRDRLRVISGGN